MLYFTLTSVLSRDHRYDSYMNSQECLVNPAATFLARYSHLLRLDQISYSVQCSLFSQVFSTVPTQVIFRFSKTLSAMEQSANSVSTVFPY